VLNSIAIFYDIFLDVLESSAEKDTPIFFKDAYN